MIRCFTTEIEQLAALWRSSAPPTYEWKPDANKPPKEGITGGWFVHNGGIEGYAKPSRFPGPKNPDEIGNPTAAHEKIVSDLAYELRLPVPPVILWDRGEKVAKAPRQCCVSALPFWPAHPWRYVLQTPKAAARWLPVLSSGASAMGVFNSWLGNVDRVNGENLILSEALPDGALGFAYIDFTRTMSLRWREGPPSMQVALDTHFPGSAPLDNEAIRATLSAICNLQEGTIRQIVRGIPEGFLSPRRSACIVDGLLGRREPLVAAVKMKYGVEL